jgi:hypothetical protein
MTGVQPLRRSHFTPYSVRSLRRTSTVLADHE